jgi:hypothetical protein
MTRRRLYIVLLGLSLTGYAWLAWNVADEARHSVPPSACLFKEVTGIPCPSCGTTRALIALLRGDVRGSVMINPFGALLALGLLIVPFWVLGDFLLSKETFYRRYAAAERILTRTRWMQAAAVAVVLFNWAWNISKGL